MDSLELIDPDPPSCNNQLYNIQDVNAAFTAAKEGRLFGGQWRIYCRAILQYTNQELATQLYCTVLYYGQGFRFKYHHRSRGGGGGES